VNHKPLISLNSFRVRL